jgi:hypothetical protein
MEGHRGSSWRERHEAGLARERAGNAAWVQRRFDVPLSRTILRELPVTALVFLLGYLFQGWIWGAVSAALFLSVILAFRVWARRHYGISDN